MTGRLAVALVLLATVTAAADAPADTGRDRARTFLAQRVVETLGLSDAKATELRGILRGADDRRAQLVARRDALEAQLRTALAHTPHDEAKLATLVGEANEVGRELATLPEHTFAEAQKILTVDQQARLLLFRRELQGEVHQAMQRRIRAGGAPAKSAGR